MSKAEVVAAQKAAILSGQDAALEAGLESLYDAAAQEQKASDGTLGQGDLDAAVKAAVDPLNAKIAQDVLDLAAAHTEADAHLADVQKALDDLSAKEKPEAAALASLQSSAASLKAALDAINAAIPAAPVAP